MNGHRFANFSSSDSSSRSLVAESYSSLRVRAADDDWRVGDDEDGDRLYNAIFDVDLLRSIG